MQNVSRIQKHPDTLIKNFFIGGLTQRKLQSDIFPKDKKKAEDMFNLEPEMLFSLYEEPEKMAAYLGQVFPDKVRILQTEKMVDPKFFTFMSVDAEGFNQYNHCLIFYERFTENLIREDFDEKAYIERLVRKREKIEYKQQQKEELAGIGGQNGQQDKDSRSPSEGNNSGGASFGRAGELRIARRRMDRVQLQKDPIQEQPQDLEKQTVQQELVQMSSEIASRQTESSIVKRRNFTQSSKNEGQGLFGTPTAAAAAQARPQLGKTVTRPGQNSDNQSPLLKRDIVKKGLKCGFEEVKQGLVSTWNRVSKQNSGRNLMPTVQETIEENQSNSLSQSTHKLGSVVIAEDSEDDEDNYRDSLFGKNREEAQPDGVNSSSIYKKRHFPDSDPAESIAPKIDFSDLVKQTSQNSGSSIQERSAPEIIIDATPKSWQSKTTSAPSAPTVGNLQPGNQHSTGSTSVHGGSSFQGRPSDTSFNPLHKGDQYFAPIAFVIQTEVEHHDIFKEVLLSLFESIRKPEQICSTKQKDRQLAFADFLGHIAFLASMPCPTFNTRYHIEFFGKTLTVAEPNYDEVPDKNQLAIRVLFDMLDVRTIIYCWKAILFDQTLVLISSQYSLQFYIAQALLQLVFPLTFQYSYVQPASAARIGMVQSPFPILFACSHLVQDFDYFEKLGKSHIAICDIDGSYTNNIEFPQLEDEKRLLRSLSALKNFKGAKFDSAFHEMYQEELIASDKKFTIEVRNVFFGILDQFLNQLPEGEYFKTLEKGQERAFINYFDTEKYLDEFEGTQNKDFAERLMNSQLFATFCDDHFDRDVSNMLIYLNIRSNGFNFDEADEKDRSMKDGFEQRMAKIWREVRETGEVQESRDELDSKLHMRSLQRTSTNGEDTLAKAMDQIQQKGANLGNQRFKDDGTSTNNHDCNLSDLKNCVRTDVCDGIKDWPQQQKIDICWRIPQDNQRVMIFEKLEYALACFDREREICKTYGDSEEQLLDENHREHMRNLFKTIKDLKKLYQDKLPMYCQQMKWAAKDANYEQHMSVSDNISDNTSSSNLTPVQTNDLWRNKTFMETKQETNVSEFSIDRNSADNALTNQNSNQKTNNLELSNKTNDTQDDKKWMQLSQLGSDGDQLNDLGQLNRSTKNYGNLEKQVNQQKIAPRQKSQHMKRGPAKDFSQATHEFAADIERQQEEEMTMAELFWKQREENTEHFSANRIVEICYGLNGLIDFLDLLFTQFPSKRQVKAKFNYYFALRKQIQAIEQQVTDELHQSENKNINSWFTSHKGLLEQLQPQTSKTSSTSSMPQVSPLYLKPTVSIVFQGADGEVCGLKQNMERATSVKLWDMQDAQKPLEVQGGELGVFKKSNVKSDVWMLPVLPEAVPIEQGSNEFLTDIEKLVAFRTSYQYISLKQKLFFAFEDQEEAILLIFGEFLLFSQRDRQIFPTYRFYELLEVMTQPQKNRIFSKIVTHLSRPDEQMFQLRLMFEHEINGMDADKDEPVSLDDTFFDQDFLVEPKKPVQRPELRPSQTVPISDKNFLILPPAQKQQAKSKNSLQPSKKNSMTTPCASTKQKSTSKNVQHLQNLTKEMQQKMKKDKKMGTSTTGQGTQRQIRGVSPRSGPQNSHRSEPPEFSTTQRTTETTDNDGFEFVSKSQAVEADTARNMALNMTEQSSDNDQFSAKSSMNFDKASFMRTHDAKDMVVVNPEKRVKKLLLSLIDLYTEVFDKNIFNEVHQKIVKTDAIPELKAKFKALRQQEKEKLGSVKIAFESIFDTPEARQDQEIIKRCFWINLFNYKILQKVLEVFLTKPRALHKLTNCTMFVCFMSSVKVEVQGHTITCYEIFKTLLRHQDIHLLSGAFEDPVRTIDEMPAEIQELAVQEPHNLASFGLFLPIKKWSNFTVYEKETFEEQLRKVIHSVNDRMYISPDNFLIRIPKFFFRVQGNEQVVTRTSHSEMKMDQNEVIALLKHMIDEHIIEPKDEDDSVYSSIVTVLGQIENERRSDMQPNAVGEKTSHVCEVDNFWWKFDLLCIRTNIREYCNQTGRNQPQNGTESRFSTIANVLSQSQSQVAQVEESKQAAAANADPIAHNHGKMYEHGKAGKSSGHQPKSAFAQNFK